MRGVLNTNLKGPNRKIQKVLGLGLLALTAACSQSSSDSPTLAELQNSKVVAGAGADKQFNMAGGDLRVLGRARLEEMIANGEARRLNVPPARGDEDDPQDPAELVIGFPKAALGTEHYFGAVITKTNDRDSEEFGGLKLTDMTPFHVYPRQQSDAQANTSNLLLEGCPEKCRPNFRDREVISSLPISAENATQIFIDFSVIGEGLNLVQIMDPEGEFLHLRNVSSRTVEAAYSHDTLSFDVLGLMEAIPLEGQEPQPNAHQVTFTTRWYLKKRVVNNNFRGQVATNGVGYFMTERFVTPKAQKHAHKNAANQPVSTHYFIKNVPEEHKAVFRQALEDWNDVFEEKIGARILTSEFVDGEAAESVVAGDVRIKVLEWDLVNKAGYGGLGPSIADQETGAMITSNTLVQGPEIINIYTEWFQVNQEARALREIGEDARADEVLKNARGALFQEIQDNSNKPQLVLSMGNHKFNMNSADPRVQDPIAATPLDFEILPANMTYEEYMRGYFRELVAHELGHNMGLRHNFRGNLFANNELSEGHVSVSIMEYLARPYRHKNRIADYDKMAIAYGYANRAPTRRDQFCTDEEVGNLVRHTGSAECSRDDAENNPYGLLVSRLTRARDLYIGKDNAEAPTWTREDALPHVTKYNDGVLLYGESAQRSMASWLRFFEGAGRPARNAEAVKAYVAQTLATVACEQGLEADIIADKGEGTPAAETALANLADYRSITRDRLREVLGDTLAARITCAPTAPNAP